MNISWEHFRNKLKLIRINKILIPITINPNQKKKKLCTFLESINKIYSQTKNKSWSVSDQFLFSIVDFFSCIKIDFTDLISMLDRFYCIKIDVDCKKIMIKDNIKNSWKMSNLIYILTSRLVKSIFFFHVNMECIV